MKQLQQPTWGKKGNVAIMAGVSITALMGFFALVLNVGILYNKKIAGENVAESAAIAASMELDATPAGLTAARNAAAALIAANDPNNVLKFDKQSEVTFGIWDESTQKFTASAEPLVINAVKVTTNRNQRKSNGIEVIFSSLIGSSSSVDMAASAIASTFPGDPPGEAPIFPIAVSSCAVKEIVNNVATNDIACGREIVIGDGDRSLCKSNKGDCAVDRDSKHIRWTLGSTSNINANDIRTQANNVTACLQGNSSACTAARSSVAGTMTTSSGNMVGAFNSNSATFPTYLSNQQAAGKKVTVQVPVYSDAGCSDFVAATTCSCNDSGSSKSDKSDKSSKGKSSSKSSKSDKSGDSSCSCDSGHGDTNKGSDRNKTINGFASLEIKSIKTTGDQKYVRAVVSCGVTVNQKTAKSLKISSGDNSSRRNGYGTVTPPVTKPVCGK